MNPAEHAKRRWKLTGKPHWPLTTYEKVWGLWKLAGIHITLGVALIFSPLILFSFISFPVGSAVVNLYVLMGPVMGFLAILFGFMGIINWWELIHGTIPEPAPWARIVAYSMNEPDPWKERAEMQARLDEAKREHS